MNRKVSANNLRTFAEQVFQVAGVLREEAETAAAVMIEANLCGVDSHGVRMLPGYITLIHNGKINPRGQIRVLKETPMIAHLDGNLEKDGIPLDEITLGELRTLANQSGVPFLIGA